MSNRGQAQYLRIFDEATTYLRWQGYYVGQTVTWDSQSWSYFPFVANGLIGGSAGSDSGVSVSVPATAAAVAAFDAALDQNRLVEIKVYEFSTLLTQAQPQSSQLLIGSFIGEVTGISGSFSTLEIQLGSGLAPVGAQAPPRKYTNLLVGAPLRL
jgi:hypothetical protein